MLKTLFASLFGCFEDKDPASPQFNKQFFVTAFFVVVFGGLLFGVTLHEQDWKVKFSRAMEKSRGVVPVHAQTGARFLASDVLSPERGKLFGEQSTIELAGERTLTTKKFATKRNDGRISLKTHYYSSPVHYLDPVSKTFEDINFDLMPAQHGWYVKQSPFQLFLYEDLHDGLFAFSYAQNLFRVTSPLVETTKNFNAKKNDARTLWYQDALGKNVDIEIVVQKNSLIKKVIVRDLNAARALPGDEQYAEIPFRIESQDETALIVDGEELASGESARGTSTAVLRNATGEEMYILSAVAHTFRKNHHSSPFPIEILYRKENDGSIVFIKRIPRAWLTEVQYPIETDAVFSFHATASDGFVQRYVEPTETWSQIRTSAGNSASIEEKADCQILAQEFAWRAIGRCVFKFDTSDIADDASVTSVTLRLFLASHVDQFNMNDGRENLDIVHATTASDNMLIAADYAIENFGTTILGVLDYDDAVDGAYNSIALDLSSVNRTGITTFGGLIHADQSDAEPAGTWTNHLLRYMVKTTEAGVALEPYLEVEIILDAPAAPTALEVNSQVNPVDVSTVNPSFSAIHANASSTASARAYQIQVSTSASSWGTLFWDSGKVSFLDPVPAGDRSPEIISPVTFPLDGTTYYWRMHFWDQMDHEGEWSTESAAFTMFDTPLPPPPPPIASTTVSTENFNSYVNGDLNGQGGWSGADAFGVQGTVVYEGAKALVVSHGGSRKSYSIARALDFGDANKDMRWSFRFNYDAKGNNTKLTGNPRNPKNSTYWISANAGMLGVFGFGINEVPGLLYFSNGVVTVDLVSSGLGQNTWYLVEMERRASDGAARARFNGGTWSDWMPPVAPHATMDRLEVTHIDRSAGKFWLDNFLVMQ